MPQSNILLRTGAAILLMKNIRACESLRRNSMASFLSDGYAAAVDEGPGVW
jgi:hypothetical protein